MITGKRPPRYRVSAVRADPFTMRFTDDRKLERADKLGRSKSGLRS